MNWVPEVLNGLKDTAIVVFLGYGLKFMKQQNELKQAEIDAQKAHIKRLESLQEPAIARDLEQMTRTADKLAEAKQKLEADKQKLMENLEAVKQAVEHALTIDNEERKAATTEALKDVIEQVRQRQMSSYLVGVAAASYQAVVLLEEALESEAERRQH